MDRGCSPRGGLDAGAGGSEDEWSRLWEAEVFTEHSGSSERRPIAPSEQTRSELYDAPRYYGKDATTSNVQRSASAEDGEPRTTAHRTHEGTVMWNSDPHGVDYGWLAASNRRSWLRGSKYSVSVSLLGAGSKFGTTSSRLSHGRDENRGLDRMSAQTQDAWLKAFCINVRRNHINSRLMTIFLISWAMFICYVRLHIIVSNEMFTM